MKFFNKLFASLCMVMAVLFTSFSLVSCDDDDDDTISDIQDYYVEFSVKDKGTLTNQEANIMVGELNAEGYFVDDCSKSEAIHYFDEWARELSRELNEDSYNFEATIAMKLMDEQKKAVKQHLLMFSKAGCRLD